MTGIRIVEKQSSDCFTLGLCPYSEIFDINCEELCENCKFCPVTCGHFNEIFSIQDSTEEWNADCNYFEPHSVKEHEDIIEQIYWIALSYNEDLTSESAEEILSNICLTCGFKFEGKLNHVDGRKTNEISK